MPALLSFKNGISKTNSNLELAIKKVFLEMLRSANFILHLKNNYHYFKYFY